MSKNKKKSDWKKKKYAPQPVLTPRGAYTLFEHPQKLFEVEFPSDWDWGIDDEDGRTTQFRPKDQEHVNLTVYLAPFSFDTDLITKSPLAVEAFTKFFEKMGVTNPQRDNTFPYFSLRAERSIEHCSGPVWMIAACDLILSVTAYAPHGELHLWEQTFERMLSTFRVPRETEAVFSRASIHLCGKVREQWPKEDFKVAGSEIRGKSRSIPLGNLFHSIKQNPNDWESIADEFFERTTAVMGTDDLGQEKLADCKDKIYPFIRPDSFAEPSAKLVQSEWLANLTINYVINIPSAFRYLTQHDLQRWNIDAEELHQIALANLADLPFPDKSVEVSQGALPMIFVHAGDNMEASRLLLPTLYQRFSVLMNGPFIAAIPCRDALILIPNDIEMRRRFQQIVRQDYKDSSYAITDRLFLVTPDGITLAEW